jgi:hypothetical protein
MKFQLSNLRNLPGQAAVFARTPRARKIGWWIFGVLAAIAVLGFLVAPPFVRSKLEQELTRALHRKVAIEALRINPYALSVTVRGLRINERDADSSALTVEEIYANVSSASLFRLAPVLSEMRVTRPQVQVVRVEANRYNWSDLIDEFINKPRDPKEPPARFALANIEIVDGGIAFDDRPQRVKHVVSAIHLAVPFVSSLPVHQEITIEPRFSASVNGTPLELLAKAKPFRPTRDSSLNLDIHGLDLTRFLEYVPGGLPVKVNAAKLETDLDITFAQPKDRAPTVVLSGKLALLDLDVQEPSGAPLLKMPRLAVELGEVEPLMRRVEIKKIALESPELRVHRRKNGEIFLLRLATPKAGAAKTPTKDAAEIPPLSFSVTEIALTAGKLEVLDERSARPVRMKFDDMRLTLNDLSGKADAVGKFDAYLHSTNDETLALNGTVGLQPLQAAGTLKLERARLPAVWPYVEPFVAMDATDGQLDAATAFTYSAGGDTPNVMLKDIEVALRSLVLQQRWDKLELLRIPALAVHGGTLDLRGQAVTVGELTTSGGRIGVRRDREGKVNLQKLVAANPDAPAPAASATAAAAKPWTATLKKLAVDRYAANVEDEAAGPAATARIENLALTGSNLSTAKGERGNITLKLTANKTGTLALSGPVVLAPPSARLKIDARNLGIVPAQPYFEGYVNAIVSSGDITASGDAVIELAEGGAPRGSFKGNVTLANFAAVNKTGNEDLLRWKSFDIAGIDAVLDPLKVAVGEVALTDFFARVVLTPAGRLNLQDVFPGKDAAAPDSAPATAAAAAAPAVPVDKAAQKPAATTVAAPEIPAKGATSGHAPDIQIGKITLSGGNVNFSDFFIKPNYSANLTGVTGSVSKITRETSGDVDLRAKIDNTAPVEIAGKINPLAKDLTLDIKASAHDIELAPLSPYSVKYVGYGIEKGKLSMKVAYKLENRKLTAQNNVILNQLTFGAKVDSPTALKLPVLFAVSLLKDRNGVIDIDLPISGSIDDPKFSVGGIIWQVVGNLLLKAVTAPFALIGALFGGGEELAYIEFTPGSAALTATADTKLKNIAKALSDRPALKLDIAGRVDADADRAGLKKTSLERKVKTQKLKDTVKGGAAAGALEQVTVEPAEYPKYLARAYGEEKFTKPRNMIGLAKDLPVPEMEQLMTANAQVTEEDLRQLANQRAQAVKDYLVETSKVPADRVFLLASRLSAEGIKDKGRTTRVDFSLK